jgi:hypothetical protein
MVHAGPTVESNEAFSNSFCRQLSHGISDENLLRPPDTLQISTPSGAQSGQIEATAVELDNCFAYI